MKAIFLGTNNWFDTTTGSTPCILLDAPEAYVILDAGFGIYKADRYMKEEKPVCLFITHFHIDHVCGLHVLPKFNFKQGLTIFFAKKMTKYYKILFEHPFAMPAREMRYKVSTVGLREGEHAEPFKFECRRLKHADLTYGYRMHLGGKIVTYCADTAVCENDYLLGKDSDLFIHECAFIREKESQWGHTGPEGAADLARRANAEKLALTHFGANSYANLELRRNAEAKARRIFPNTVAATDGMVIEV